MRLFSRIQNRLMVAFLFVVTTPLCVVGVYSILHTTRTLEREAVDSLWQETHLKAGQLERFLGQMRGDLFYISQSPALKSFIEVTTSERVDDGGYAKSKTIEQLSAFLERFTDYSAIRYVDEAGLEQFRIEQGPGGLKRIPNANEDFRTAGFFVETMRLTAGEIHLSSVRGPERGAGRQQEFLFATRLFSSRMERRGILALEVASAKLLELLAGSTPASKQQGTALIGLDGRVLVVKGFFPYSESALTALPSSLFSQIVSEKNGVVAGLRDEIISFAPVYPLPDKPSSSWMLITVIPKGDVLSAVTSYKKVFSLILVAALALAFVLSTFFARQLTGPLTRLLHGTKLLGEGKLGHRTDIRTGDETEDLASAFNTMAQRLEEFYTSLEDKVAEKTVELTQANVELELRQSELKQAYEELKETHRKLQESERELIQSEKLSSIGRLAASVAHEINNPIGIISLYSQLLKEDIQGEEALRKLDLVVQHTQKVSLITKDLLDFSRKTRAEFKTVSVESLLRTSLLSAQARIPTQNIEVVLTIDEEGLAVTGEEGQLVQVLTNLINNACQAMPEGGTLTLSGTPLPDGLVKLTIKDTGDGIAEQDMDKIFEPFYTTKPAGQGTGLGLAVCYGIIKSHKGRIRVESAPGQGAAFIIELPKG